MALQELKYASFLAGSAVVSRLPGRLAYRCADAAAALAFRANGRGRAAVVSNLRHVVGAGTPGETIERCAREVFRTAARNYVDLFRLPRLAPEAIDGCVERHGTEYLDQALALQRGVIVVGAHFGNFDVVAQVQRHWPVDFTVLVEPLNPPELLALVCRLRAARGIRLVPAGPGALLDAVRRLRRGEMIGLAVDRNVRGAGAPLPFFGAEARLPTGAATLAVRTGAPLLPAFGVRHDGGYAVFVEPAIEPDRTGDVDADVRSTAIRVLAVVEHYIRRWPGQWVVFEPIWDDGPKSQVPSPKSPIEGIDDADRAALILTRTRRRVIDISSAEASNSADPGIRRPDRHARFDRHFIGLALISIMRRRERESISCLDKHFNPPPSLRGKGAGGLGLSREAAP